MHIYNLMFRSATLQICNLPHLAGLYKMAGVSGRVLSLSARGAVADMLLWAIARVQTRVFASRSYQQCDSLASRPCCPTLYICQGAIVWPGHAAVGHRTSADLDLCQPLLPAVRLINQQLYTCTRCSHCRRSHLRIPRRAQPFMSHLGRHTQRLLHHARFTAAMFSSNMHSDVVRHG